MAHTWVRAGNLSICGGDGHDYVVVGSFSWAPRSHTDNVRREELKMTSYTCYGLKLKSDIPLPELGAEQDETATPDIVIERGVVTGPPHDATMIREGMWRSPTSIGIDIPQVARFVADDGRRIVIESEPDVPDGDVRIFLLGTMIGSIMMQRDHLVLHGTAFRVGNACAVVVGRSGAGKSTLAAELARRGLDVLSDDVVPIDAVGRALPGSSPHQAVE